MLAVDAAELAQAMQAQLLRHPVHVRCAVAVLVLLLPQSPACLLLLLLSPLLHACWWLQQLAQQSTKGSMASSKRRCAAASPWMPCTLNRRAAQPAVRHAGRGAACMSACAGCMRAGCRTPRRLLKRQQHDGCRAMLQLHPVPRLAAIQQPGGTAASSSSGDGHRAGWRAQKAAGQAAAHALLLPACSSCSLRQMWMEQPPLPQQQQ